MYTNNFSFQRMICSESKSFYITEYVYKTFHAVPRTPVVSNAFRYTLLQLFERILDQLSEEFESEKNQTCDMITYLKNKKDDSFCENLSSYLYMCNNNELYFIPTFIFNNISMCKYGKNT